jgi:hypothetical protein
MGQDVLAQQVIPVALEAAAFHEIDCATKEGFELTLHVKQIVKRWPAPGRESHQDVDIAVWAEVVPQYRPKQSDFDKPPAEGKRGDCFVVEGDVNGHQRTFAR